MHSKNTRRVFFFFVLTLFLGESACLGIPAAVRHGLCAVVYGLCISTELGCAFGLGSSVFSMPEKRCRYIVSECLSGNVIPLIVLIFSLVKKNSSPKSYAVGDYDKWQKCIHYHFFFFSLSVFDSNFIH